MSPNVIEIMCRNRGLQYRVETEITFVGKDIGSGN